MSIASTHRIYLDEINKKNSVIREMAANLADQQQAILEVVKELNELIEYNIFSPEVECKIYKCIEKLLTNEA